MDNSKSSHNAISVHLDSEPYSIASNDSNVLNAGTLQKIAVQQLAREWDAPAVIIHGFIRVRGLRVDAAVVLDVLEGVVHESAITAVVPVRLAAVDEVLFRQRHQEPSLAEVLPL